MSRVSFEHVRRGVIRHVSGVEPDLEGTSVIKKKRVAAVVLAVVLVQTVVCGRRQKMIFTGTKQIVSHLRSFESVFPVLRHYSCFSRVTGGQGRKEIITSSSSSSKWLKVSQELRGRKRDMFVRVCKVCGAKSKKDDGETYLL